MDADIAFAKREHIPVLPLLMEWNLESYTSDETACLFGGIYTLWHQAWGGFSIEKYDRRK